MFAQNKQQEQTYFRILTAVKAPGTRRESKYTNMLESWNFCEEEILIL